METDLFGDVSPQQAERREKFYEQRFWQLNELLTQHSKSVWQYLLTVNGGGAVAMLAFIGAVEKIRSSIWPYWALALFMIGLILVGLALAYLVHKFQSMQDNWKQDVSSYFERKITWAEALKRDQHRVDKLQLLPWVFGWSSFAFFFIGVVFTALKLASLAE